MKLTISLIFIGIFQIVAGGFYGLLAPIRAEENIQTDLNGARSAAEERLKTKLPSGFAEEWPEDFEIYMSGEMEETENLARTAREGWSYLNMASLILAGTGVFIFAAGFNRLFVHSLKSEPDV